MPQMPPSHRRRGTGSDSRQDYEQSRGSAAARGYGWEWSKASKAHLAANPLCLYCALDGFVRAATLVDHLYPHRGDMVLFWLRRLWVSSCKGCHDGFKKAVEMQGHEAIDALALRLGIAPLDPKGDGGQKSGNHGA